MIKSPEQVEEKETTEQPVNYPPGIGRKIKRYGRIKKGLNILYVVGCISAGTSPFIANFWGYDAPKIAETYQDAQTSLETLQIIKENWSNNLSGMPYKTQEVETFYRNKPDKAIKSLESAISKIEARPEFEKYQEIEKKKENIFLKFFLGGLLVSIAGAIGAVHSSRKKKTLEEEYKNENN